MRGRMMLSTLAMLAAASFPVPNDRPDSKVEVFRATPGESVRVRTPTEERNRHERKASRRSRNARKKRRGF